MVFICASAYLFSTPGFLNLYSLDCPVSLLHFASFPSHLGKLILVHSINIFHIS